MESTTYSKNALLLPTRSRSREPSSRELWLVWASGFFLQSYTGGLALALNLAYAEILIVFQSSSSEASLVQSLYTGLALGGGIMWNYPSVKIGIGNTIILTSLLGSFGILVSAYAVNVTMIIVFVGVISGIGHGYCFLVPSVIVNTFYKKHKGVLLAALTTGPSLGQIVLTFLMEYLLEAYDLSGMFLIFCGLSLNCVVCGFVVRSFENKAVSKVADTDSKQALWKTSVLKDWKNVLLMLLAMIMTFCVMAETKFIVDLMVFRGFERQTGSLYASILGFANLIGRLFGTVTTLCRRSALGEASVASILLAGSHAIVVYIPSSEGLLAGTLLNGFSYGLIVSKTALYAMELVGPQDFAAVYSLWILWSGAGNFIGGVIGGVIKDLTGSYDLMFIIALSLSIFCALLFLLLFVGVKKPSRKLPLDEITDETDITESTRLLGR